MNGRFARPEAVVTAKLVLDVVVTGEDRNDIGLLIVALPGTATDGEYRQRVTKALSGINAEHSGASRRVVRALILLDPPTFDSGEMTEKGSLNARLIRQRRRELVGQLHDGTHIDLILIQ